MIYSFTDKKPKTTSPKDNPYEKIEKHNEWKSHNFFLSRKSITILSMLTG